MWHIKWMEVVDAYLTYLINYVLRIRAFSYSITNIDIHSNEHYCATAQQTYGFFLPNRNFWSYRCFFFSRISCRLRLKYGGWICSARNRWWFIRCTSGICVGTLCCRRFANGCRHRCQIQVRHFGFIFLHILTAMNIFIHCRDNFKQVQQLKDQKVQTGGVAVIQHQSRFIYYLVTKSSTYEKPTYRDLYSSLQAMKEHMVNHFSVQIHR